MLKRFVRDERAATAIEYSLIAAIVSMAILAGAGSIFTELQAIYQKAADEIQQSNTNLP
ncbi:MAG: Flp family type IVb pilin [Aquamicrobium sp.]|uniref:Flp family type IVb pilin n=1 Tax=Aquamicrobium sp. TaxID=1872579 RepID=UPI00349ED035|nr:Flp family type IVb pilin [Aquamicrobium sp.]